MMRELSELVEVTRGYGWQGRFNCWCRKCSAVHFVCGYKLQASEQQSICNKCVMVYKQINYEGK